MKILLIYSGGIDSTVLLYKLLSEGHSVSAVSFDYGQKHRRELICAKEICAMKNVEHEVVAIPSLPQIVAGASPVIPNRNMIFLAHATSLTLIKGGEAVAYGCHGGDAAVFPDCRPFFVRAMFEAMISCDLTPVELLTPFLFNTKKEIVEIGRTLKVDFEKTWSCYEGGEKPCGFCPACVAREEVLFDHGVCPYCDHVHCWPPESFCKPPAPGMKIHEVDDPLGFAPQDKR